MAEPDFRALCAQPALVEGRERPVPTEQNMNDLAEVVLGLGLPRGDGARLIRRALELWGHIPIAPIPIAERLPGPEDCCGNPRNGQGEWCWGRETPRTPAGTPVIWRLMRRDCLEDEAAQWLPWWAIPIPTTQDFNND
jgi:hypothetical protein